MDDKLLKIARKIKAIEDDLNKITQIKDLEGLLFVNTEITNKYKKSINDVVSTYKDYTVKTQKELAESMKILEGDYKEKAIENKNIIKDLDNRTNKIKEDIKNICVSLDKSIENIQKDILKDIKTQNEGIELNLKNKDKEISLIKKENKVLKDNLTKLKELFDKLELQKGETGKSAYEIACELGFKGTVEEWLKSLHGKDGKEIELRGMRAFSDAPKDGKTYGRKNKKWVELSGSGGTTDYEDLNNLPKINNVELKGNKTLEDLGIENYDDTELKQEDILIKKDIKGIAMLGQAQGENITLNDSAECRLQDIVVKGNSWQETRSGKNLFNVETKTDNVAFAWATGNTFAEDKSIITDYIPKGNLTSLYSNYSFNAFYYDTNKVYLGNGPDLITTTDLSSLNTTVPDNSNVAYIRVEWRSVNNSNADMATKTDIMLTKAQAELTPYEPYGVSPSPDYPSDIRNVGDNINEFDGELEIGSIDGNGQNTVNENSVRTKNYQEVIPGEYYTLQNDLEYRNNIGYFYDDSKNFLTTIANSTTEKKTNNDGSYTFLIPDNVKYIKWRTSQTPTQNNLNVKYKLEKGKKATPYSSPSCGKFNIIATNKNIFNGFRSLGANATYIDGILSVSASGTDAVCQGNYLIPRGIRTYYFSYNSSYATARYYVAEYDENYTQIRSTSKTAQTSFTIGNDASYFSIIWNFASGTTFPITISNMQLEEGTTATTYTEHQEQNIIFPLSQGQRLMEGDYLADDGIHHVRGQVVLDGSSDESWTANGSNQGYGIHINGIGGLDIDSQSADAYCNCLKKGGQVLVYQGLSDNVFSVRGGNTSKIYVRYDSSITTVALLRQQLSSQPITVEYELATEVVEPYTQEQQAVYNEIKNLHTYKNVTHIYSENEISPEFDVIYCEDINNLPKDVQINGTSIVNNGVANIPIGSSLTEGVVKTDISHGTHMNGSIIYVVKAADSETKAGASNYKAIVPNNQHQSVFYGLAKAAGDTTQASSSNAVGTYTDTAKQKIQEMIGILSVEEVEF